MWAVVGMAVGAGLAVGSADQPVYMTPGKIYPPPTGVHVTRGVPGGEAPVPLSDSSFSIVAGADASQTLQKAITRLRVAPFAYGPAPPAPPYTLKVEVNQQQIASTVDEGVIDPDESYELNVTSASAIIVARTDFGALRGLNSFVQLVQYNLTAQANYVIIPQLITDSPRLAYRGVMVDTGRVFISVAQLRTLCNAMEAWRFNALNIHLTDVQSWPMEIDGLPNLSGLLSYMHETQRHVYSIADARNLSQHCLERGVRVIPEIDAPGHFPAAAAYPELGVCLRRSGPNCTKRGLFDITSEQAWSTLEKLWTSIIESFPTGEYNIGGDEVDMALWKSPSISDWNQKYADGCPDDPNITCATSSDLHPYFTRRLISIIRKLSPTARVMGWSPGIGGFYKYGTLATRYPYVSYLNWNGYSPRGHWQDSMATMTENEEASVILAGPYYVVEPKYPDCLKDPNRMLYDWEQMMHVDPLNFTGSTVAKSRVRGAMLTMWGDITGADSVTATPTALPYMAAMSSTLWHAPPGHYADPNNLTHMASCEGSDDQACNDLASARCKMLAMFGLTAGGFSGPKHISQGCLVPYDPTASLYRDYP